MTNPNKAHVTLVCDRTGSMSSVQAEAENGVNVFINDRRNDPVDVSLLLVQFDTQDPFEVLHEGPVMDAVPYRLVPRGSTPLLDAVGRAIVSTGEILAAISEDDRPAKVVFVIQTDGHENASREYSAERIREMVKHQTETYGWQFVFLGTGLDAWSGQASMGIDYGTHAVATADSLRSTYRNTSAAVTSYFVGAIEDMAGTNVSIDEDGKVTSR